MTHNTLYLNKKFTIVAVTLLSITSTHGFANGVIEVCDQDLQRCYDENSATVVSLRDFQIPSLKQRAANLEYEAEACQRTVDSISSQIEKLQHDYGKAENAITAGGKARENASEILTVIKKYHDSLNEIRKTIAGDLFPKILLEVQEYMVASDNALENRKRLRGQFIVALIFSGKNPPNGMTSEQVGKLFAENLGYYRALEKIQKNRSLGINFENSSIIKAFIPKPDQSSTDNIPPWSRDLAASMRKAADEVSRGMAAFEALERILAELEAKVNVQLETAKRERELSVSNYRTINSELNEKISDRNAKRNDCNNLINQKHDIPNKINDCINGINAANERWHSCRYDHCHQEIVKIDSKSP